jgi:hypothetical protein
VNYVSQSSWDAEFAARSTLFAPLAGAAGGLRHCTGWPALRDLNALLPPEPRTIVSGGGQRLKFVAPAAARAAQQTAYEPRAYLSGELATREENWHDLFNALTWLTFPKAKAAINSRHYEALSSKPASAARGPARDALTLFDESGVVIACGDASLLHLVENFAWKELFWRRRRDVITAMRCYVFGHGLYEKILSPFVGLTGKAASFVVPAEFFSMPWAEQLTALDARLAVRIASAFRHPRELNPLPILGIPGASVDNEREEYYDNSDYFRPGRRANASSAR